MEHNDWMDGPNPEPEQEIDDIIRSARQDFQGGGAQRGPVDPLQLRHQDVYADLGSDEEEAEPPEPEYRDSGIGRGWKVLIYTLLVLTFSVLLALFGRYCADDVLALTKSDRVVSVTISEQDDASVIASRLHQKGLVRYPWLFRFYCWFSHAEEKIDAGTYELNNLYDYHALVNGMRGNTNRATDTVTIPEGYDCAQIFALLEERGVCAEAELYEAAANTPFDYDFLKGVPYGEKNRLEGYLFPDTYEFYISNDVKAVPGERAEQVLVKFLDNYEKRFDGNLREGIDELNGKLREKMTAEGFTAEEIEAAMMDENKIVIVASLIEKESAAVSESDTIASVIYNRLCSKNYPLLEIDASVLYALGEHKESLTSQDLMVDSPYNTRRYPGLPAGPIANPGLGSIRAALYPEDTDYYFYALGTDGKHHFSETYQEHEQFLESADYAG